MEMDATTKWKMLEGELDWYNRLDERVQKGSWISGYGLSLIGRKIHWAFACPCSAAFRH